MHELQILDMINTGIVVLDRDLLVSRWNRWMEQRSEIETETIVGKHIFDHFPMLDTPRFHRNCKAVFRFGNFCFLSQKLHGYFFPFRPDGHFRNDIDLMQQNCTIGPLYNSSREINHLFISVEDVTGTVLYQNRLTELGRRDGLTGLYNRRYMTQQLTREFERARRYNRPLTLMMLDIDNFKQINDSYGHQFGDDVIRSIAGLLLQELRNMDFVARFGGEEFCCFLPETGLAAAADVAERIREKVADMTYYFQQSPITATISIGVAENSTAMANHEDLLRVADDELYRAKKNGRNRVCSRQ